VFHLRRHVGTRPPIAAPTNSDLKRKWPDFNLILIIQVSYFERTMIDENLGWPAEMP
jgi:hypothetical protein